jgi:hypothetical protein
MHHSFVTAGVLEINSTALYWRVIDSVNGSLVDEVFLTK